jgi:hypothetical protein
MSKDKQKSVDTGIAALQKVRDVLKEHGIEISHVGEINADFLSDDSVRLVLRVHVPVDSADASSGAKLSKS